LFWWGRTLACHRDWAWPLKPKVSTCGAHSMCYSSPCWDQWPDRNNARKEGLIWVHGFWDVSPSWRGGHGGAELFTSW
jgi:hypothetical protein